MFYINTFEKRNTLPFSLFFWSSPLRLHPAKPNRNMHANISNMGVIEFVMAGILFLCLVFIFIRK